MKLQNIKKGFTLIELLVVILIIGILATGGISVFTTQLQGARDSVRFSDIKLMETASNQYFNDESLYPTLVGFTGAIKPFLNKEVRDSKSGLTICLNYSAPSTGVPSICNGFYASFPDAYGLPGGAFKMGVAFEKRSNIKKGEGDGGNIDGIFEVYGGEGGFSGTLLTTTAIY